jgi:hypothetical protein
MNKATRILVMTGMALVAGATVGAGPASASTATPAAPSTTTKAAAKADWDRTVGYFRNPTACRIAGAIGERRGQWDDSYCVRVGGGFRRGLWALQVSYDNHHGHGFPGHGFPGQGHSFPGQGGPGHGPGFPGQGGPHFPGQGGPGFPRR